MRGDHKARDRTPAQEARKGQSMAEEFAAPPLECAVCIAEVADGEAARFLPGCGHGFHAECVDLWLGSHSTCPLCRVAVDDGRSRNAASATRTATAPPFALPPVQPEPANYAAATSLPTNVLFWGTHGAVRTTTARTIHVDGRHTGPCPSSGGEAATVLVMEVPATTTTTTTATATTALRDGGAAAKPQGSSARLVGSLRRMWS
uniref:RING-type domain-containing protein n=1 Tax=Oryza brachyantha TaxID=4533 RepID=J3LY82_ORYBR